MAFDEPNVADSHIEICHALSPRHDPLRVGVIVVSWRFNSTIKGEIFTMHSPVEMANLHKMFSELGSPVYVERNFA